MSKRWILTTVIGLAVTGPAWGQIARGPGQSAAADLGRSIRQQQTLSGARQPSLLQKWLDQNIESVSFADTLFEEVVQWLRDLPGEMNIVVEWIVMEGEGVDREAPITLELRNVRLGKVLDLVLKQAGGDVPLGYQGTDNILTITLEEVLHGPEEFVIRTYHVADLIRIYSNFDKAPSIRLSNLQQQTSGGGASGSNLFSDDDDDEDSGDLSERVQRVIDMIVETVEPQSWTQNGGQGIATSLNDVIIVNNSISVHEKLGGAIRQQRAAR